MMNDRQSSVPLRAEVECLLRRVFPDNCVTMEADYDLEAFEELTDRLGATLTAIPDASIAYEHGTAGELFEEDPEETEDALGWTDDSRSYHLWFVTPAGQGFEFETETTGTDAETGKEEIFPGTGRWGGVVAVSCLAPVAVVCWRTHETFQDGSQIAPDVEEVMFNLDGTPMDLEAHVRKYQGAEAAAVLRQLEARLIAILEAARLKVLPREELNKPVPWLRPAPDAFVGGGDEPLTVRDAFFFHGP